MGLGFSRVRVALNRGASGRRGARRAKLSSESHHVRELLSAFAGKKREEGLTGGVARGKEDTASRWRAGLREKEERKRWAAGKRRSGPAGLGFFSGFHLIK